MSSNTEWVVVEPEWLAAYLEEAPAGEPTQVARRTEGGVWSRRAAVNSLTRQGDGGWTLHPAQRGMRSVNVGNEPLRVLLPVGLADGLPSDGIVRIDRVTA